MLFWHNWLLTLVTFIVGPVIALILKWVNRHIKRLTTQTQQTFGELIGTIQESYSGERVVKVYDGYDYESARFRDVNERLRSLTLKAQKVYSAGTPLTQFASMAGSIDRYRVRPDAGQHGTANGWGVHHVFGCNASFIAADPQTL